MKPYAIAFVFLIFCGTIHAQQTTPVPLTPDQIFVEGVQWSLIEPEPLPTNPVKIDPERMVVSVLDATNTWQDYPIPDGLRRISKGEIQPDGKVKLYFDGEYFVVPAKPRDVIILDPTTGLFESPASVCDEQIFKANPGEGEWAVAYADNTYYLCFSEDGTQLDVLPDDLMDWQVISSPDDAYLLLIGKDWALQGEFRVIAYQIQNNLFTELGTIDRTFHNSAAVCEWMTNTQGLMCAMDNGHVRDGSAFYAFDLTQAHSIELAFTGWEESIVRIDNPMRYVAMQGDSYFALMMGSHAPDHPPCRMSLYDSTGIRHQELGYECIPLILDEFTTIPFYNNGNMLYYLTVESESATTSSLRAFDVVSGSGNNAIFTGEIESIVGVSPNNQYLVALLDDNGELNFTWDWQ